MIHEHRHLLVASLPAALIGVFNLGAQLRAVLPDASPVWQLELLAGLGVGAAASGGIAALLTGAAFWLPLLLASLIVSFGWAFAFAHWRRQPIDPAWLPAAWLFSLLLPATAPPGFVALGLSFGLVFGCHVFGGSGRYLVNPALLGIVFLAVAYPALVGPGAWLPASGAQSTWALVAAGGVDAFDGSLLDAFRGRQIGAFGASSALACLLGAGYLIAVRVVPMSIVAGGLIGLIAAGALGGGIPWAWQLALGNFAFVLAFVAADPTPRPTTRAGAWIFGALFGVLVIVLRTANPAHPEGSWAALLLASLSVPLIDHVAGSVASIRRRPGNA